MAEDKKITAIALTLINVLVSLILAVSNVPDPTAIAINAITKSLNIASNIFQNALPANATQAHAIISNVNSSSIIALNILGFWGASLNLYCL